MTLTSDLATLVSDGLTRLISLYPEVEYLFRHALVQEAGYLALVRSQRRRLH